jgi:hypothetical protein
MARGMGMVGSLLAVMIAAGAASAGPPPYSLGNPDRFLVEDTLETIDPATRTVLDKVYRNCLAECGSLHGSLCGWPNKFSCLGQKHSCRVDCAMERTAIEEALRQTKRR